MSNEGRREELLAAGVPVEHINAELGPETLASVQEVEGSGFSPLEAIKNARDSINDAIADAVVDAFDSAVEKVSELASSPSQEQELSGNVDISAYDSLNREELMDVYAQSVAEYNIHSTGQETTLSAEVLGGLAEKSDEQIAEYIVGLENNIAQFEERGSSQAQEGGVEVPQTSPAPEPEQETIHIKPSRDLDGNPINGHEAPEPRQFDLEEKSVVKPGRSRVEGLVVKGDAPEPEQVESTPADQGVALPSDTDVAAMSPDMRRAMIASFPAGSFPSAEEDQISHERDETATRDAESAAAALEGAIPQNGEVEGEQVEFKENSPESTSEYTEEDIANLDLSHLDPELRQEMVDILTSDSPAIPEVSAEQAQVNDTYAGLHEMISQAKEQADIDGKPVLILLGENHTSKESLLVEHMVMDIAEDLGINQNLAIESNPEALEKARDNSEGITSTFNVNDLTNRADGAEYNVSAIDTCENRDSHDARESEMADGIKGLEGSVIAVVGSYHIKGLAENPELQSEFNVVSLNVSNPEVGELREFEDAKQEDLETLQHVFTDESVTQVTFDAHHNSTISDVVDHAKEDTLAEYMSDSDLSMDDLTQMSKDENQAIREMADAASENFQTNGQSIDREEALANLVENSDLAKEKYSEEFGMTGDAVEAPPAVALAGDEISGGDSPAPPAAASAGDEISGGDNPAPPAAASAGDEISGGDSPAPPTAASAGDEISGGDSPAPPTAASAGDEISGGDSPAPPAAASAGDEISGGDSSPAPPTMAGLDEALGALGDLGVTGGGEDLSEASNLVPSQGISEDKVAELASQVEGIVQL